MGGKRYQDADSGQTCPDLRPEPPLDTHQQSERATNRPFRGNKATVLTFVSQSMPKPTAVLCRPGGMPPGYWDFTSPPHTPPLSCTHDGDDKSEDICAIHEIAATQDSLYQQLTADTATKPEVHPITFPHCDPMPRDEDAMRYPHSNDTQDIPPEVQSRQVMNQTICQTVLKPDAREFVPQTVTLAEAQARWLLSKPDWMSIEDMARSLDHLQVQLTTVQYQFSSTCDQTHRQLLEQEHTSLFQKLLYYHKAVSIARQTSHFIDYQSLCAEQSKVILQLKASVSDLLQMIAGLKTQMQAPPRPPSHDQFLKCKLSQDQTSAQVVNEIDVAMAEMEQEFMKAKAQWGKERAWLEASKKLLAELVNERDNEIEEMRVAKAIS